MTSADGLRWRDKLGGWFALAAGLWLALACGLIAGLWAGWPRWLALPWPIVAYLWLTVVASAICFLLYGIDKRRAARSGRRISERMLHAGALAGGWPGALFAQRLFRHKTQKTSFRVVYWLIVLVHLGVIGWGLMVIFNAEPPTPAPAPATESP